jgi:hypothetical protein
MNRGRAIRTWMTRGAVAMLACAAGSCGDSGNTASPTTPTQAPTIVALTTNLASVTLQRPGSAMLTATATKSDGVTLDVTSTATWLSSNPEIATANAGVIDAAARGTAKVSVGYGGFIRTVDVTVLRTTVLQGTISVFMATADGLLSRIAVSIDGAEAATSPCSVRAAFSDCSVTFAVAGTASEVRVSPGTHQLSVRIDGAGPGDVLPSVLASSNLRLVDRDSKAILTTYQVGLPAATSMLSGSSLTWPLDVPAYQ